MSTKWRSASPTCGAAESAVRTGQTQPRGDGGNPSPRGIGVSPGYRQPTGVWSRTGGAELGMLV